MLDIQSPRKISELAIIVSTKEIFQWNKKKTNLLLLHTINFEPECSEEALKLC